MSSIPDPAAAYIYVDWAVHGAHRRNHVSTLAGLNTPEGLFDSFITYLRYDEGLLAHARGSITEDHPKPSVSGWRGACWTPMLPLDFDDEMDPQHAIEDGRRLLTWIALRHGVAPETCGIRFSGGKGVHLELPEELFGKFAPSAELPNQLGRLSASIARAAGLTTVDDGIYNHLRLLRVTNSRHGKSGLYAIPLTAAELFTQDLMAIRELARDARPVPAPVSAEAVPALVSLWQQAQRPAPVRHTPIAASGTIAEGGRHTALVRELGRLRRGNWPEPAIIKGLLAFNAEVCAPPLDEAEVLRVATSGRQWLPAAAPATRPTWRQQLASLAVRG